MSAVLVMFDASIVALLCVIAFIAGIGIGAWLMAGGPVSTAEVDDGGSSPGRR